MNLFVCSTPYQIYNAVNISQSLFNEEISDIYVLNVSSSILEIYNKIKESKIFRKVYLIEVDKNTKNNKFFYYINRLKKIIFTKRMIPNQDSMYDRIFIVGTEVFSKVIYYYWYNKNNKIDLCYFEDGTGSYSRILIESRNLLKHRILRYIKGFDIIRNCKYLYVYRPDCVMSSFKSIELIQIPLINKTEKYMNKLKNILKKSENENIYNNFIFFDSDFGNNIILNQQIEYVRILKKELGNKKFHMKLHPNSNINLYGDGIDILKTTDGFEIINLEYNVSEKVLISIMSSACLTPKLIYNEEPYIVFLYNLSKETRDYAPDFLKLVNKIKNIYDKPEKILIPNTIQEYKEMINKLNSLV